jgi:hypothetical protein
MALNPQSLDFHISHIKTSYPSVEDQDQKHLIGPTNNSFIFYALSSHGNIRFYSQELLQFSWNPWNSTSTLIILPAKPVIESLFWHNLLSDSGDISSNLLAHPLMPLFIREALLNSTLKLFESSWHTLVHELPAGAVRRP